MGSPTCPKGFPTCPMTFPTCLMRLPTCPIMFWICPINSMWRTVIHESKQLIRQSSHPSVKSGFIEADWSFDQPKNTLRFLLWQKRGKISIYQSPLWDLFFCFIWLKVKYISHRLISPCLKNFKNCFHFVSFGYFVYSMYLLYFCTAYFWPQGGGDSAHTPIHVGYCRICEQKF